MGKHIYNNNNTTEGSITMAAICSGGTQIITTGLTTNTEVSDKLSVRLLPPTFSYAADDVLLLATSTSPATTPDCYSFEYVRAMTATSVTKKNASNKKSRINAAFARDRNCNKRNNSNNGSRTKYYNNNNIRNLNISGRSSCYIHGSKSQHNLSSSSGNNNSSSSKIDCPTAATATITATVTTASCYAGESGKMLMQQQPAEQLVTTMSTTITPACKISHRKNKRSSNNNNKNNYHCNATSNATAVTTTADCRRATPCTTTAKISKAKVAARSTPAASIIKLKLPPSAVGALPITMLLQLLQLLKNTTTKPTTTTTDKVLSAAARCQAAAMASTSATTRTRFRLLPGLGATSFFTLLTLICLETVLLSTVSNCAKTFYMHWNTSNSMKRRLNWTSNEVAILLELWEERIPALRGTKKNTHVFAEIGAELASRGYSYTGVDIKNKLHNLTNKYRFRIDNTDHIIDVNKGNLAFEFDQVHIICPVYEPGTFENETEKYIIYNVSKVEYETCRITNADPRVIAICDKPQKLMFFTITFRPFTPQPGGLEFLPGNDYYFISTSSKDDLYRRIGGRCSTNNMKVVFKVCCAPEEKNKTTSSVGSSGGAGQVSGAGSPTGSSVANNAAGATDNGVGVGGGTSGLDLGNVDVLNAPTNIGQHPHMNNINTIGINGVNTGLMAIGGGVGVNGGGIGGNAGGGGIQLKPLNGVIGTSINTNVDQFNRIPMQTNGVSVMGNNIGGMGLGSHGGNGIMLTPGGGVPHGGINLIPSGGIGQFPGQTGIRINNVASQQHHPTHKVNNNNNHNGKDAVADVGVNGGTIINGISFGDGQFLPPVINTNLSNIVQSTMNWPVWVSGKNTNTNNDHYINSHINNLTATTTTTANSDHNNPLNINYYSPSHRPTNNKKNKNDHFDKHPNEVVKNEELTYNSGAVSVLPRWRLFSAPSWLLGGVDGLNVALVDTVCGTWLFGVCPTSWYKISTHCSTYRSSSSCTCGSGSSVRIKQQLQQHSNFRILRQEITTSKSIVNFKYLVFSYYQVIVVTIALIIIVIKCMRKSMLSAVSATHTATASITPADSMSRAAAVSQARATATQLLSLSSASSSTSPTKTALLHRPQTERPEKQNLDLVESKESSYLIVNYYNSKTTLNYSENVESFR